MPFFFEEINYLIVFLFLEFSIDTFCFKILIVSSLRILIFAMDAASLLPYNI